MILHLILTLLLSQNTGYNDLHFEQMINALNLLGQHAEQAEQIKDDQNEAAITSLESRKIVTFTLSNKLIVQKMFNKKWYPIISDNYKTLKSKLTDRTMSNFKLSLDSFELVLKNVKQ